MRENMLSVRKNKEAARLVQDIFMNTCMRVYTNDDVLGVELCGAMKNIIALASGASTLDICHLELSFFWECSPNIISYPPRGLQGRPAPTRNASLMTVPSSVGI